MISIFSLSMALAMTPDAGTSKHDNVKALLKDAIGATDSDPSNEAKPSLDISKMPFTPDAIKQVVKHHQPQISACYETMLAGKDKASEGVVKTSFTINGEGFVSRARVDKKQSSLKDPSLHTCVVTVISAMVFPKPPDGKDHPVEFPFNLKAVQ